MESRKKEWFAQLAERATSYLQQSHEAAEKKAVEEFRENSENMQKLIEIKKASDASKKGLFGNFRLVQAWGQLDPLGAEKINKVLKATTFAEMLQILDISFRDEDDKWRAETICSVAGNAVQNANALHYMLQLHKEILAYAIQHDIPLMPKNQQRPSHS